MPFVFKCNIYKIVPKLEIPAEIAKIVQFLYSNQCATKYEFINKAFLATEN